ncbi:hypothetical protein [Paenibacillus chitinolyticus]|uniref:hypothetical protein n=1 Tax=Paenibacillus chitinolyticus TaxID=79263 RepID=UPI00295E4A8E|nr:hypothetical protein [Paenibacillus chitinolyticus]
MYTRIRVNEKRPRCWKVTDYSIRPLVKRRPSPLAGIGLQAGSGSVRLPIYDQPGSTWSGPAFRRANHELAFLQGMAALKPGDPAARRQALKRTCRVSEPLAGSASGCI